MTYTSSSPVEMNAASGYMATARLIQPAVQRDDAPAEKLLARRAGWTFSHRAARTTSAYLQHQHVAVLTVLAPSSRKLRVCQVSSTYNEVHMHALAHVWRAEPGLPSFGAILLMRWSGE